eukprot:Skav228470  [mRNA]  locus=scaffold1233:189421:190236:+ [translate_table: standard]
MTAERIPLVAAMLRFPRASSDEEGKAKPIFVDASPKAFDVLLEMARGRKRTAQVVSGGSSVEDPGSESLRQKAVAEGNLWQALPVIESPLSALLQAVGCPL